MTIAMAPLESLPPVQVVAGSASAPTVAAEFEAMIGEATAALHHESDADSDTPSTDLDESDETDAAVADAVNIALTPPPLPLTDAVVALPADAAATEALTAVTSAGASSSEDPTALDTSDTPPPSTASGRRFGRWGDRNAGQNGIESQNALGGQDQVEAQSVAGTNTTVEGRHQGATPKVLEVESAARTADADLSIDLALPKGPASEPVVESIPKVVPTPDAAMAASVTPAPVAIEPVTASTTTESSQVAVSGESHEVDPAWSQIARSIQRVRHDVDGSQTMSVRLDPPELGTVEIEVRVHDGRLSVHAATDSTTTRDLLLRAMPELRASLEANGIATNSLDVGARTPDQNLADSMGHNHGRDGQSQSAHGGAHGRGPDASRGDPRHRAEPHAGNSINRLDLHL